MTIESNEHSETTEAVADEHVEAVVDEHGEVIVTGHGEEITGHGEVGGHGETHAESSEFVPPTLASETIGHIGGFEIRNTMIMAWIVMAILIIVALVLKKRKYQMVPTGLQNLVESIVGFMFDFFDAIVQDRKQTMKFFPIVATIFIFIILANWLGIFPGVGTVLIEGMHDGHEMMIPVFRSMNADVNMTFAFAVVSVIGTQVFGIAALGTFKYGGKFFVNPLKDPIGTFVGLLEFISEFAKMVSFTFRLFGNIFAGEILLMVMGFLVPFLAPMPFLVLEIFVGFVQALVFALLTLVFMKMAVTAHH